MRTPEQNATFVQQANRHHQQQLEIALEATGIEAGLVETLLSRMLVVAGKSRPCLLGKGMKKGSYKTVYSAGHGVRLIDRVESIKEIIERTVKEYLEICSLLPGTSGEDLKP